MIDVRVQQAADEEWLVWLEKWCKENTYFNDAGEECLNGDLLLAAKKKVKGE